MNGLHNDREIPLGYYLNGLHTQELGAEETGCLGSIIYRETFFQNDPTVCWILKVKLAVEKIPNK